VTAVVVCKNFPRTTTGGCILAMLAAEILWPWYSVNVALAALWLWGVVQVSTLAVRFSSYKRVYEQVIESRICSTSSPMPQWIFGQLLPPGLVLLPFVTTVQNLVARQTSAQMEKRTPIPELDDVATNSDQDQGPLILRATTAPD